MHDTIGCYLDLEKGHISFSKNGAVLLAIIFITQHVHNFDNGEYHCLGFLLLGNDLGLAFEIPQNLRNQAFFASCVLKVPLVNTKIEGAGLTPLINLVHICLSECRVKVQLWRRRI